MGTLHDAPLDGCKLYFGMPIWADESQRMPAPAEPGVWGYYLRLVDGKGQTVNKPDWAGGGVWQNGEIVELAVPDTLNTEFGVVLLPDIQLPSGATAHDLYSLGYQFEFIQGAVPEPSSLLALGMGLAGLIALAQRYRR